MEHGEPMTKTSETWVCLTCKAEMPDVRYETTCKHEEEKGCSGVFKPKSEMAIAIEVRA
jgi:hypothetical protein